jgi:hypothetical protein
MTAVEPDRIICKAYPTYGECIYCGPWAGDLDLTDEHIVPCSMGGNAPIRDGNRKASAEESTKCGGELAKVAMGDFRNSLGEQTRQPKKRAKIGSFLASAQLRLSMACWSTPSWWVPRCSGEAVCGFSVDSGMTQQRKRQAKQSEFGGCPQ